MRKRSTWSEFLIKTRTHICQWAQNNLLKGKQVFIAHRFTLLFSVSENCTFLKSLHVQFASPINVSWFQDVYIFVLENKTSQVTYVTMVPRVGNETLRPLGVAMGNAVSMTRVWRYICKNTNCWPATAHDVTTGATIIKEPPGEYIIRFFVWSLCPKHGPKPRGRSVSFPTRGTMVTYVTWDVPLHGKFELGPLGVAMGRGRYTHATMLRGVQANFAKKASTKGQKAWAAYPKILSCWVPELPDPG